MNRTHRITAIAALGVLTVAGSVGAAARPDRPEPADEGRPPISVPAADPTSDTTVPMRPSRATGNGPDTTGPAAYGLCTAWAHIAEQARSAPPFRGLSDATCAALLDAKHTTKSEHHPEMTPRATGLERAAAASGRDVP